MEQYKFWFVFDGHSLWLDIIATLSCSIPLIKRATFDNTKFMYIEFKNKILPFEKPSIKASINVNDEWGRVYDLWYIERRGKRGGYRGGGYKCKLPKISGKTKWKCVRNITVCLFSAEMICKDSNDSNKSHQTTISALNTYTVADDNN